MEHNYKKYCFYACEREATTEGEELEAGEEDKWWAYTILYAAAGGTTVAMACAKKLGATVLLVMEQWRVQVFFILNLLLLAIFLTSLRSSSPASIRRKTRQRKQSSSRDSESKSDSESRVVESRVAENKKDGETEKCGKEEEEEKLTMEELNERAEAFIAKFREHLVRDAAIEGRGIGTFG